MFDPRVSKIVSKQPKPGQAFFVRIGVVSSFVLSYLRRLGTPRNVYQHHENRFHDARGKKINFNEKNEWRSRGTCLDDNEIESAAPLRICRRKLTSRAVSTLGDGESLWLEEQAPDFLVGVSETGRTDEESR